MTQAVLIGIDVGGTHTDGVALDRATGEILRTLKVSTGGDTTASVTNALEALLEGFPREAVSRVSLSTTLVTNAVVTNRLEPVGMILMAGPGLDPALFSDDPHWKVVDGAIDHRGREITPLDNRRVQRVLEEFAFKGVSVAAAAGKFSVRNPTHELAVAKAADHAFDCVLCSHKLSGSLNFPRRIATVYLAGGVWRRHMNFLASVKKAALAHNCSAPLYLLKADGGAALASGFENAAEGALSGPAASIMGIMALADVSEESIGLDIGGTTTDISFYVNGAPLVEHGGATIGAYRTQIHALFNRSIPAGGDSAVRWNGSEFSIGPDRAGPPSCLGGPLPTPTDAMVVLGLASGDRELALASLVGVASAAGVDVGGAALEILAKLAGIIREACAGYLHEVNQLPVYTIHELLTGHKVRPSKIVLVGGPAHALKGVIATAFHLPVTVPDHCGVANAIGAAVASLNLEVNGLADTAAGHLTIPEAGVYRSIGRDYSMDDLLSEARAELLKLAAATGPGEAEKVRMDPVERESFNIIEGYGLAGSLHRLRMQVRPSILTSVGGGR